MADRRAGSRPYSTARQNFDFSGFTPLIREIYRRMQLEIPRLQESLPYCIYQHAMTEFLNAYLMDLARFTNSLSMIYAEGYNIPLPIYDYICGIGHISIAGDEVNWNLPDIAVPEPSYKGDGDSSRLPCRSGTFGAVTAASHNAYECYFSPYITSEYIIRTGSISPESREREWSPFPRGWTPENCIPTENLLGYKPIENLHIVGRNNCLQCDFEDSDTITGLLCHSYHAMSLCSREIERLRNIQVVKACFKQRENSAAFIFKESEDVIGTELILWDQPATLKSPFRFSASASNQANYYAYKRKRTEGAPGTCFVSRENRSVPSDWLETRNDNFFCTGAFGLHCLRDRKSLRESYHEEVASPGSVSQDIFSWLDFKEGSGRNGWNPKAPTTNKLLYLHVGDQRESKEKYRFGQNFDFAGFNCLIRDVYHKMALEQDIRFDDSDDEGLYQLENLMPYCIYQHVMTEFLNAYLLHLGKFVLQLPRLQNLQDPLFAIGAEYYSIPKPIYDYICGIGPNISSAGNKVHWSLPDIAVPEPSYKGDGESSRLPCRSGTFGPIGAASHNAYECYFSPYITSEYIKKTGSFSPESREREWSPFPRGWAPENCIPTENLLGYKPIENLHIVGRKACLQCNFEDSDTITGLLCHSARAMDLCSGVIERLRNIKVVKACFKQRENSAAFIFKKSEDVIRNELSLWDQSATLKSPFRFSASALNQANYYAYKRKRTEGAPGTCFVCRENRSAPSNWLDTINDNFLCTGAFGLQKGFTDCESLRESWHSEHLHIFESFSWLDKVLLKKNKFNKILPMRNTSSCPRNTRLYL